MSGEKKMLVVEGLLASGVWIELIRNESGLEDGITWPEAMKSIIDFLMAEDMNTAHFSTAQYLIKIRTKQFIAFRARIEDL